MDHLPEVEMDIQIFLALENLTTMWACELVEFYYIT
jgi:hypothetical protein